jgi:hypothetical protein
MDKYIKSKSFVIHFPFSSERGLDFNVYLCCTRTRIRFKPQIAVLKVENEGICRGELHLTVHVSKVVDSGLHAVILFSKVEVIWNEAECEYEEEDHTIYFDLP